MMIGKKEIKLSLFADDMIVYSYVGNSKESTKTLIYNIARLQDTRLICKSQLLSYIPSMNSTSYISTHTPQ